LVDIIMRDSVVIIVGGVQIGYSRWLRYLPSRYPAPWYPETMSNIKNVDVRLGYKI
jgi:hypothetical protein